MFNSSPFPLFNSLFIMPLPKPVGDYFYSLLNHPSDDPLFDRIFQQQGKDKVVIKQFPDCTYHSYKHLGLSLSFVQATDKTMVLDAIDIYNGITNDGFQPYDLDIPLPCGLDRTLQAHAIVSRLGEPDRKGGGGQSRVPCWIEYTFEQGGGGLMIQLHGIDWDDRNMGWTSCIAAYGGLGHS
ncbi:hypothetical protein BC941DRAFT_501908 [Chlamydoabsidia padenii]|nr:hypothetical protein BC941DRAFT_501908 [Chlamydoabsidia padenii]